MILFSKGSQRSNKNHTAPSVENDIKQYGLNHSLYLNENVTRTGYHSTFSNPIVGQARIRAGKKPTPNSHPKIHTISKVDLHIGKPTHKKNTSQGIIRKGFTKKLKNPKKIMLSSKKQKKNKVNPIRVPSPFLDEEVPKVNSQRHWKSSIPPKKKVDKSPKNTSTVEDEVMIIHSTNSVTTSFLKTNERPKTSLASRQRHKHLARSVQTSTDTTAPYEVVMSNLYKPTSIPSPYHKDQPDFHFIKSRPSRPQTSSSKRSTSTKSTARSSTSLGFHREYPYDHSKPPKTASKKSFKKRILAKFKKKKKKKMIARPKTSQGRLTHKKSYTVTPIEELESDEDYSSDEEEVGEDEKLDLSFHDVDQLNEIKRNNPPSKRYSDSEESQDDRVETEFPSTNIYITTKTPKKPGKRKKKLSKRSKLMKRFRTLMKSHDVSDEFLRDNDLLVNNKLTIDSASSLSKLLELLPTISSDSAWKQFEKAHHKLFGYKKVEVPVIRERSTLKINVKTPDFHVETSFRTESPLLESPNLKINNPVPMKGVPLSHPHALEPPMMTPFENTLSPLNEKIEFKTPTSNPRNPPLSVSKVQWSRNPQLEQFERHASKTNPDLNRLLADTRQHTTLYSYMNRVGSKRINSILASDDEAISTKSIYPNSSTNNANDKDLSQILPPEDQYSFDPHSEILTQDAQDALLTMLLQKPDPMYNPPKRLSKKTSLKKRPATSYPSFRQNSKPLLITSPLSYVKK
mmetsp:Transcript_4956/g.7345  ORF Transcript_4956/g.7345 Transcript_4956/m.7345 type:complete len:741 (+) Transcript_4956:144-2366(+)